MDCFDLQRYFDWKLDIVKQVKWDLSGINGKMTSNKNFKLKLSKMLLDIVTGFYLEFDVIWEVWFQWILIWLKIGYCKTRNVEFTGSGEKQRQQQLQTKIFFTVIGCS